MTQDGLWLSLLLHLGSHLNPLCSMVAETWLLLETDSVGVLECVFALFTQDGCQLFGNLPCVFSGLENLRPSPKSPKFTSHCSLSPPPPSLPHYVLTPFLPFFNYILSLFQKFKHGQKDLLSKTGHGSLGPAFQLSEGKQWDHRFKTNLISMVKSFLRITK